VIWGTGTPRREFLYADDCADALRVPAKTYSGDEHVNVGSGTDVTILELAEIGEGPIRDRLYRRDRARHVASRTGRRAS
jgi:nucleoside-diphosphate-sugar epimerase